jgi:hypothetical protein
VISIKKCTEKLQDFFFVECHILHVNVHLTFFSADIEKEDGCDAKFGLVLTCIRGGVVAVMDKLKSKESSKE